MCSSLNVPEIEHHGPVGEPVRPYDSTDCGDADAAVSLEPDASLRPRFVWGGRNSFSR